MDTIKFYSGNNIPIEMHKVKIVQQLSLLPIEERKKKLDQAGNNMFLLMNRDIFLDMLTDSGVNAMSDQMQASMLIADDSYAGSNTYLKLKEKLEEIFGMTYFLPAHQGRACEHILVKQFVKKGDIIPMNYKFDSIKEHLEKAGAYIKEMISPEALDSSANIPFKGNLDLQKLEEIILQNGREKIPFIRIEAGTNLIGGQPISLENMKNVSEICKQHNIPLVLDASLLQDNLYFIKKREDKYKDKSIRQITREIADLMDIIYFSARKLGFARGGGICVRNKEYYVDMQKYITMYEGFLTYGGMSVKEMEAITIGLEETMNESVISQGPQFIEYMADKLKTHGIPVVSPSGGLGVHIDAKKFLPHLKMSEYPAGALSAAIYLCSGVRTMERGTISVDRDKDGTEKFADMELVRIALPRRVFTLSQIEYVIDRLIWIYDNREIIKGLRFEYEPKESRFYFGLLRPIDEWQFELMRRYKRYFGLY